MAKKYYQHTAAWISFIAAMILLFGIVWIIQSISGGFVIEGAIAIILLVVFGLMSGYFAFILTRWQHRVLDTKSIGTNYLVLAALVLLTILLLPTSMNYIE